MDVQNIEKLNQLISRTDMTGNEKVEWLIAFTENYQALQLQQTGVIYQLCACGGNERVALDCTLKDCKHPKYWKK